MFKYIMFQDMHGSKHPIIFPKMLNHIDVAHAISRMPSPNPLRPISAGFVVLEIPIVCYGESETLKMKCEEGDTLILSTYPWHHGIKDGAIHTLELVMIEQERRRAKKS